MSNSEDVTYSEEFEEDENNSAKSKTKPSASYSSIGSDAAGSSTTVDPNINPINRSHSLDSKHEIRTKVNESKDVTHPASFSVPGTSDDEEEASDDDSSSQQFSNAIERYEKRLARMESNTAGKSSSEMSEISEIMRQLQKMEETRNELLDEDDLEPLPAFRAGFKSSSNSKTSIHSQDSVRSSSTNGTLKTEHDQTNEIDDIIKKLESLEEAQNALENALSESDRDQFVHTGRKLSKSRSSKSSIGPSKVKSKSTPRQYSQPNSKSLSLFHTQQDDDTADEMSLISELNSSRKHSSAEHFKLAATSVAGPSSRQENIKLNKLDRPRTTSSLQQKVVHPDFLASKDKQTRDQGIQYSDHNSPSGEKENNETKLRDEVIRQDSLIAAYQKEIEHLYKQMSDEKNTWTSKEKEFEDAANQLKTEIATLKINHLIPVLPSSPRLGQKGELERLKEDLNIKSNQVMELRGEVALLKIENTKLKTSVAEMSSQSHITAMPDEKEKEYQRNIKNLEKQVRTLQKLAFHKDNTSLASHDTTFSRNTSAKHDEQENALKVSSSSQTQTAKITDTEDPANKERCNILEFRISELENELMKADSDAQQKVKEFQERFASLKGKYDIRITELENKVAQNEERVHVPSESFALQELTVNYEKSQGEVTTLKHEVSRYKREIDILTKASKSSQNSSRQDANALSLALKSFKVELAEKEKEVIRCRKEIAEIRKTNTSLRRESSKHVQNAGFPFHPPNQIGKFVRTKSDLFQPPKSRYSIAPKQQNSVSESADRNANANAIHSSTIDELRSTLEEERAEFEKIIKEKSVAIETRDKEIKNLEDKLNKLDIPVNRRDSLDEKNVRIEELRSRVSSQNRIIETMKIHMANYNGVEAQIKSLKQEKGQLEFRIRELNQQLVLAKTLSKPEHEILRDLMEKVESLNSRYSYHESQIDTLLNRLATTAVTSNTRAIMLPSPQFVPGDSFPIFSNDPDNMSPSASLNLNDI